MTIKSKLLLAIASTLLLTTTGSAQTPPEPAGAMLFDTLNEAAVYALANAYRLSHYYEVGGVLGQIGAKYAIGKPVSDLSGDSIRTMQMDPLAYKGRIVGTYHTHPCMSNTHRPGAFSSEDTHTDRSFHIIGFMADMCTGKVTMYDPAVDISKEAASADGWVGHEIGSFTVDGIVLDVQLLEIL